jgi:hypothetical protein
MPLIQVRLTENQNKIVGIARILQHKKTKSDTIAMIIDEWGEKNGRKY